MSTVIPNPAVSVPSPRPLDRIPPLQTGDRLSRDEFERRYHAMPKKFKAELIEGIVYVMGPPVSDPGHSHPHFGFIGWLAQYEAQTPGTAGGDNGTIRLDLVNEPQPDTFLRILPACRSDARYQRPLHRRLAGVRRGNRRFEREL